MDACKCRGSAIAVLLLLARLSFSMVFERQDLTLTALSPSAASDLVNNNLTYTANCTAGSQWHNDLPTNNAGLVTGAGPGNNSINIAFLRSSLPLEYQNSTDSDLADFYEEMSQGNLASTDWLGTAVDDVEAVCLAPKLEKQLTLDQLNATQNCTATAEFLTNLGWAEGPHPYNSALYSNNSAWLDFIYYALPNATQNNITDVELVRSAHLLLPYLACSHEFLRDNAQISVVEQLLTASLPRTLTTTTLQLQQATLLSALS